MNILEAQRLGRELLAEVTESADPPAVSLSFLLRHAVDELDDPSREALEAALGRAIAGRTRVGETGPAGSAEAVEWLPVFVRLAALSADPRVAALVADLVARVRAGWPSCGAVGDGALAVASCLAAVDMLDAVAPPDGSGVASRDADSARALLQAALDELEGLVHRAYQPGVGMRGTVGGEPGSDEQELLAQVATAHALLCAYAVTGRTPYAMLAEELMLVARRRWWQEPAGGFGAPGDQIAAPAVSANGLAVAVLCALARVASNAEWHVSDHASASYRHDAECVLAWLGERRRAAVGPARADYALALAEWLEGS